MALVLPNSQEANTTAEDVRRAAEGVEYATRVVNPAGAHLPRPNIIVIVVDDLRWDEFGAAGHPYVETPNIDRLVHEGASFTSAFHAVPLCSPNRASLLTGQYPSRHGIIDNVARSLASHRLETFPQALQAEGYETGFLGKWHMGNDPTPRPGFDYWAAIPGQGRIVNPTLMENGAPREVKGYITDVLTDRATAFIERERDKPFFLFLGHKAVHPDAIQRDDGSVDKSYPMEYLPAPRHAGRYTDRTFPRRPSTTWDLDKIDSPAIRQALQYRNSEAVTRDFGAILDPGISEDTIRNRAEMLLSVDEGVGRIISTLESLGILDQTALFFTSDNGFFFGEHGLSIERRMPYDESIRSPLLIRYPKLVASGIKIDALALSVDIAPTILEMAGVAIPDRVQGRSLVPVLKGDFSQWRQSVLIEFYTYENPMPWLMDMDYRVIRTHRYKYVHWIKHSPELYDLSADPYEMRNVIDEPGMEHIADTLRTDLGRLSLKAMGLQGPAP